MDLLEDENSALTMLGKAMEWRDVKVPAELMTMLYPAMTDIDDNGTPAGGLQTLELRARQSIIGPMQEWLRSYYHTRQGRYAAVDAVDFPDEKNDPYYVQISNELTAINDELARRKKKPKKKRPGVPKDFTNLN